MIRIGIRPALIVLVTVPMLGVLVGGLFAVHALEARNKARLQEDIELIARTLQAPLSRSLQRRSDWELDLALWSAYGTGRVYGVYVYDAEGTLVAGADRGPTAVGRPPVGEGDIRQAVGGGYDSLGGQEVYSYFAPLYATSGEVIGLLQVTRDASEIHAYLAGLRWRVAWTLFGALLVLSLIAYFGHYLAIGRPLQSLADAMDSVARGNTSVRAEERGPHELRQLAHRFNGMLHAMLEKDADIARKRAQHERLEALLRDSEKYAMVGRLASGVAHELGTPLAVIDAHAQKLARGAAAEAPEAQAAAGIRSAVARMSAVIRQLLGFGRASHAARGEVSLRQLVTLAASDVRERCAADGTTVAVDSPGERLLPRADAGRLREALGHLLRNAAQAAPGGTVRVGWRDRDGDPALFVEDSGPGVDAASRERLFEPFFTTKAPGEGSGLGLAIVRGVAADHQAGLKVYESALGGAGFEMRFRRDA